MNFNFGALISPQFLIIFSVCAAAFLWWYFSNRKKNKIQKTEEQTKTGEVIYKPVDAIVYDRTTTPFSWYEKEISKEDVEKIVKAKTLGRQVVFNGKKVFRFFKILNDKNELVYEGVTEPADVKHSPIAAYIDNQHPYTPIIDDMTVEKNFMQKYGPLLIWLGVLAFLIFMVIANKH